MEKYKILKKKYKFFLMNFKFLRTLINMLVEDEMKHAIIEIFIEKLFGYPLV